MTDPKPTFNAYPMADYLVGPFSHDPTTDQSSETLTEWQQPFYDVAVNALYRVAKSDEAAQDWMPTPEQGAELYRELAYERKLHGMISGVVSYIDDYKTGTVETRLLDHQQEIFDAIMESLTQSGIDEDITIKSPTGSGKTAVLITLLRALKYKEQPSDKVRALVLVPTKDILGQTMNEFKEFAPEIDPGIYFGEKKQLKDITTMTYRSFDIAVRKGIITREMFDVIVKDEEHESGGEKLSESLDEYCTDPETGRRKAVFGLSATPRENKNLAYESNAIELIDRDILSPMSIHGYETGASIHEQMRFRKREDYAPEELEALINNDPRNRLIIQEVLSGLASGRRVVTRCLPGGELLHARMLSEYINGMTADIQDPYTSITTRRQVRSVVIDGGMPMKKRRMLSEMFNDPLRDGADGIDAIFFVDTLVRGWNSPIAKKLINACPSRSWTVMEQLLGRITRKFERKDGSLIHGQAVDLIDSSKLHKQILFSDVVNKNNPGKRYVEGAIIGPGLKDLRTGEDDAFEDMPVEEPEVEVEPRSPKVSPRPTKNAAPSSPALWNETKTVAGTFGNDPFGNAAPMTNEQREQHLSLEDLAELIETDPETLEDAIIERNVPLRVDEAGDFYVPAAYQRRLKAFIEQNY